MNSLPRSVWRHQHMDHSRNLQKSNVSKLGTTMVIPQTVWSFLIGNTGDFKGPLFWDIAAESLIFRIEHLTRFEKGTKLCLDLTQLTKFLRSCFVTCFFLQPVQSYDNCRAHVAGPIQAPRPPRWRCRRIAEGGFVNAPMRKRLATALGCAIRPRIVPGSKRVSVLLLGKTVLILFLVEQPKILVLVFVLCCIPSC